MSNLDFLSTSDSVLSEEFKKAKVFRCGMGNWEIRDGKIFSRTPQGKIIDCRSDNGDSIKSFDSRDSW